MHIPTAAGPPQHVRPWLERLAELGELAVWTPGHGSALELYEDIASTEAVPYHVVRFAATPQELAAIGASIVADTVRLRARIRRFDPDVVVVVTVGVPAAIAAARLLRTPCVVYVAELFDAEYTSSAGRAMAARTLLGFTERGAAALVCCSHAVARQFEGRSRSPVEVIYPGVTVEGATRPRRELDGGVRVGVIGNLNRARGQDVAIRALAHVRRTLPDAGLSIVGAPLPRPADRLYASELHALVAELGLEDAVEFAGFVDDVRAVYDRVDVVVNPVRFRESLGRVAIEALAAGTPVVSARVGAVPEVLTDGHDALLVPPDDPPALAEAIVRLARDGGLRRTLAANGLETARTRFDERRGADAFARLVTGLARARVVA